MKTFWIWFAIAIIHIAIVINIVVLIINHLKG